MINDVIKISINAGKLIEEVAKNSFNVKVKDDKTPVTEADLASHDYIIKALSEKFPEIPILSEESIGITLEERQSWKKYFLVDPLDGTKEFIKQNGNYSVLIALMKNNRPILGVIHAPVSNETWFAELGQGAYKVLPDGAKEKLSISKFTGGTVNVAVSASHLTSITTDFMDKRYQKYKTHPIGSAIKFCRIAEGSVDVYPRLGPTSEWDTAAGELIVNEAGGGLYQYENKDPLEYNKESLRNPWFIAFGANPKNLN